MFGVSIVISEHAILVVFCIVHNAMPPNAHGADTVIDVFTIIRTMIIIVIRVLTVPTLTTIPTW